MFAIARARSAFVTTVAFAAILTVAPSCAKDRPGAVPLEQGATRSAEMGRPAAQPERSRCGASSLSPEQHFVAEGLCTRVVAKKQGPLRGLAFAPNGDLIALTRKGEIKRYRDIDHDGLYGSTGEAVLWAKTGGEKNGHNCQLAGDFLYCGSKSTVRRWRWSADAARGGAGEDVILGMPEGGRHPGFPLLAADGFLYVVSGSASNSMSPMPADYDTNRNLVRRFALGRLSPEKALAWTDGEIVVRGSRNLTAIARDHAKKRVVAVDNSLDDAAHAGVDVHQDNPGEAIVAVEPGKKYGYPFCFFAQRIVENGRVIPPGTPVSAESKTEIPGIKEITTNVKSPRSDAWCAANVDRPLSMVQAHSSPLGLAFVDPDAKAFALPDKWKNGAFIALHGSWNRGASTAHKVVWIPASLPMPTSTAERTEMPYEVVFGGGKNGAPVDGAWSWKTGDDGEDPVRPVSVAISPVDGALYVSSDNGNGDDGAIYRIALPER